MIGLLVACNMIAVAAFSLELRLQRGYVRSGFLDAMDLDICTDRWMRLGKTDIGLRATPVLALCETVGAWRAEAKLD